MTQNNTGQPKAIDTLNEVNQKLTELSRKRELTIREALDWTDRIGNLAQRAAQVLDLENRPQETIDLYGRVADVFKETAAKVPNNYQHLIESIARTWQLSADSKRTALARPTTTKSITLPSLPLGRKRPISGYSKPLTIVSGIQSEKPQTSTYKVTIVTPTQGRTSRVMAARRIPESSNSLLRGITKDSLR